MFYDEIQRLKYIDFALRSADKRVQESLKEEWSMEIVPSIVEYLLWLMSADEWYRKNGQHLIDYESRKKEYDEGKILLGLRRAFNLFKHEMSFTHLFKAVDTKLFLKEYEIEVINKNIVWEVVPKLSDKDYDNQIENYQDYVEGLKVTYTIKEAGSFIRKLNQEVFKENRRSYE